MPGGTGTKDRKFQTESRHGRNFTYFCNEMQYDGDVCPPSADDTAREPENRARTHHAVPRCPSNGARRVISNAPSRSSEISGPLGPGGPGPTRTLD